MIQDYGSNYAPGTATHAYTLYRAPSGALVFASGACRTAWNFSDVHDLSLSSKSAADLRVQQAMVNLLADMGVQPVTLQAGLVPASASTDTTPPTSTITAPAAGAQLTVGNPVVIAGTAADSGGIVAAVEVSTDGASLASCRRPEQLDLRLDPHRRRHRHHPQSGGRRQPQPGRSRHRGHSDGNGGCERHLHPLAGLRDARPRDRQRPRRR